MLLSFAPRSSLGHPRKERAGYGMSPVRTSRRRPTTRGARASAADGKDRATVEPEARLPRKAAGRHHSERTRAGAELSETQEEARYPRCESRDSWDSLAGIPSHRFRWGNPCNRSRMIRRTRRIQARAQRTPATQSTTRHLRRVAQPLHEAGVNGLLPHLSPREVSSFA